MQILNKPGSLLFQCDYAEVTKLSANERIILASTFHSLSAIAGQLSPGMDTSGIQVPHPAHCPPPPLLSAYNLHTHAHTRMPILPVATSIVALIASCSH